MRVIKNFEIKWIQLVFLKLNESKEILKTKFEQGKFLKLNGSNEIFETKMTIRRIYKTKWKQ